MKAGIYKITNSLNTSKIYIGSSKDVDRRFRQHINLLKRGVHDNKKLQYAVNKYGIDNFVFECIEECTEELLIEREQYFMDTLNPWYNISKTAGRTSGYIHTQEAKHKMSLAKKGKPPSNKGIPASQEKREKVSSSLKQKYKDGMQHPMQGKTHTEDVKRVIKEKRATQVMPKHHSRGGGLVYKLDKDSLEVLDIFVSAPQATEGLAFKGSAETAANKIGDASKNQRNAYGYRWIFEKHLAQIKSDELLETLTDKLRAISSEVKNTFLKRSETT